MNYTLNKRDSTEADIIDALQAIGAYVVQMPGTVGWDLTVFYEGGVYIAEVKSPGGRLTKNEKTRQFHIAEMMCHYYIWYTPDDALDDVVGVIA